MQSKLRPGWYSISADRALDLAQSGIYEWRISGVGIYIGKAKTLRRRIKDYPNNVRRMIDGLAWHGNPAKDYRAIHHALRRAYEQGIPVSVGVLEICDAGERADRERAWIQLRRNEHLNGGPKVLNSN